MLGLYIIKEPPVNINWGLFYFMINAGFSSASEQICSDKIPIHIRYTLLQPLLSPIFNGTDVEMYAGTNKAM